MSSSPVAFLTGSEAMAAVSSCFRKGLAIRWVELGRGRMRGDWVWGAQHCAEV